MGYRVDCLPAAIRGGVQMPYDLYIWGQEAWDDLVSRGLDVVIDPMVLRTGQMFLEGAPADLTAADRRWSAIEEDLGALAAFFDLLVMRRQFPAFNYEDTFDPGPDVGDPLGELVNSEGDKVLFHVDVEHQMYRKAKGAALAEIGAAVARGPVVTRDVANQILRTMDSTQYEWSPSLGELSDRIRDQVERRIAQWLLGQLVFAGYAQQTGAPHVLSPQRSRLAAAVGLGAATANAHHEAALYDELRRRSRSLDGGWRVRELPWTPSFLPHLVQKTLTKPYKAGPDVLLALAKELRETRSVDRYRTLRADLLSGDATQFRDAAQTLEQAASAVARALDAKRSDVELFRQVLVALPPTAGAIAGAAVAGPVGAAAGAALGEGSKEAARLVAETAVTGSQGKLFGWYLEGLTRRSARKLLSRAMRTDFQLQSTLGKELRIIWESPTQRQKAVRSPVH